MLKYRALLFFLLKNFMSFCSGKVQYKTKPFHLHGTYSNFFSCQNFLEYFWSVNLNTSENYWLQTIMQKFLTDGSLQVLQTLNGIKSSR